jgi:hypothetical protein
MEPYEYKRPNGDVLEIRGTGAAVDAIATVSVREVFAKSPSTVVVDAADLPEITGKLHEACGLPSPVMLDSQQIPEDGSQVSYGDFRIGRDRSGVAFELHDRATSMPPRAALVLAAYIAAYAMQADAEPDPAEVAELADMLGDFPTPRTAAEMARVLLLSGKVRMVCNGE